MRRTKHRRRFHTDRVVAARRARYFREQPYYIDHHGYGRAERSYPGIPTFYAWINRDGTVYDDKRLSYGYLAARDPWDCGTTDCTVCGAWDVKSRRTREKRAWRKEVDEQID